MKRLLKAFLIACFATFYFSAAIAQNTNFGFSPAGQTQSMSVTSTSSTLTLSTNIGSTVLVQNTGTATAYLKATGGTATTSDFPIQAGWGILLNFPPGQTVAAVTASTGTTLTFSKGLGATALTGGGSGGGGLSVTDQTVWTQGASAFTPTGCVFNDAASLASGTEGTARCNTRRAFIFDVDNSGSNLYTLLSSPPVVGVNGVNQSLTGVTPNVAQTGTIFGLNVDIASVGGTAVVANPCQTTAQTPFNINLNSNAAPVVIITGTTNQKIYICSIHFNNSAAASFAVFDATTGSSCATAPHAIVGNGTSVATAANGYNFGANGGLALQNEGFAVLQTTVVSNDFCMAESVSTQTTGYGYYVKK